MQSFFEELSFLPGKWEGEGVAEFPTIATSRYREEFVVTQNEKDKVFHYEQKTWILSDDEKNGQPIFWESGFWIAMETGEWEWVSAQKSGRMEILSGRAEKTNEGWGLSFRSSAILNDERLVRSSRDYLIGNAELRYEMKMSTRSVTSFTTHLKAVLKKKP